jgi:hypothetical protein
LRYQIVPRLLTMATVWGLLLLWFLVGAQAGCLVGLLFLAAMSAILALSGTEVAFYRHRAFLNEFVRPEGWLHGAVRSNIPRLIWELLKAVVLAAFLLISSLAFEPRHWSLLLAAVLLLSLLLPRLFAILDGAAREQYRWVLARRWGTWISTVALWIESLFILIYTPSQNYLGLRWQEVVAYSAAQPTPPCPMVGELSRITAMVDALGTWAIQNFWRALAHLPDALVATVALLGIFALSFLLAWTYSRALMGVLARPWVMWELPPRTPRA